MVYSRHDLQPGAPMKSLRRFLTVAALPALVAGWTVLHIEVDAAFPAVDGSVATAPDSVWIDFSTTPDPERSSFSIRGPAGAVALTDMRIGENPEFMHARVEGSMPAGTYTVSWIAAPMDDHTVRGRYEFTVDSPS